MEDWPQVSAFTYRLRGMSNKTAHHYMRSYQLGLWRRVSDFYFGKKDDLCIGAIKRHKRALNLIDEFIEMYDKRSKHISIMHYIENSHDSNDRANHLDFDLKHFLETGFNNGKLKNSVIFLYSDHGARFSAERLNAQGDLEERLPFFSVYFPDWYKRNNPIKYENFLKNAQQLTTPFDIHETIRDLACLEKTSQQSIRGISILREIPSNRSCYDVGVNMHYCSCELDWKDVDLSQDISKTGFKFVIDYINKNLLSPAAKYCQPLQLLSRGTDVKYANVMEKENHKYYRFRFVTSPNRAMYEAVLKWNSTGGFSIESPASISRTNAYGLQSKCLDYAPERDKLIVDLRKFCFCKSFKKTRKNIRLSII